MTPAQGPGQAPDPRVREDGPGQAPLLAAFEVWYTAQRGGGVLTLTPGERLVLEAFGAFLETHYGRSVRADAGAGDRHAAARRPRHAQPGL